MTQQHLNLGALPTGVGGDTPRTAFQKIEDNTTELYSAVNGLGVVMGKNRVINGNFDVWQRGAGPFTVNGYTADCWYLGASAVSGPSLTQQAVVPGDPNFTDSSYTCGLTSTGNTDAAAHYLTLEHRCENANTFNGRAVTVSFSVYNAGAAGRQIAIEFSQFFGTGGSAVVQGIGAQKFTLAAGINRIQATVTLPSTSGKTSNVADSSLRLTIWLSSGTNYAARNGALGAQSGQLYFGEVQFELGAAKTRFELLPLALIWAQCQRFYEVIPHFFTAYNTAGATLDVTLVFAARKRAAPSISWINASYANSSNVTIVSSQPGALILRITVTATGSATINSTLAADAGL